MSNRVAVYYPSSAKLRIPFKAHIKYKLVPITGTLANGGYLNGNISGDCCGLTKDGCPAKVWSNNRYTDKYGNTINLCDVCDAITQPDKYDDIELIPNSIMYGDKKGKKIADQKNIVHLCMGDAAEFKHQTKNDIITVTNVKYLLRKMSKKEDSLFSGLDIDEALKKLTTDVLSLMKKKIFKNEPPKRDKRGSPYYLTPIGGFVKYLRDEIGKHPILMEYLDTMMEECKLTLYNAFCAYYLTAEEFEKAVGEDEYNRLGEIIFGYFQWHQDGGFGGADVRILMTFGDSDEGKKMLFVDRKTNRWYMFHTPNGTAVFFSREGGGVLRTSSIYHSIIHGAGTMTFAAEGKLKGRRVEIDENEDDGIV